MTIEKIFTPQDDAFYAVITHAAGPQGALPLTPQMLMESPSGNLFGMTQNAGMGWDANKLTGKEVLIIGTQGGIRAGDGRPVALGYHTGHWEIGMQMQIGGVGFYPTSGSPFVHMDVGGVRAWPRMPREELTFPLIATEAGVTPTTLYRRWGDLPQLLADVALERIRPIAEPADTGSLHGDLQAWTEQYIEEMGSPLGRTLLRDTLVATQEDQVTCACVDIIRDQLGIVLGRARARGEEAPDVEAMLDQLVAPIVYRILYGLQPDVAFGRKLVEQLVPEQV